LHEIILSAINLRMTRLPTNKLIGYVNTKSRNPSRARQEKLLADFELWHLIEDDIDAAIQLVRERRALVVAQIGLLGRVGPELKDIAARVHAKGGYIIEAATCLQSRNPTDAIAMGIDARRRGRLTREQAQRNARLYDDDAFSDALEMWKVGDTKAVIAAYIGVSEATLSRRLKALGAKPRTGGRPKTK
jgi:hypothetical protein